jgi:hypothetical protein
MIGQNYILLILCLGYVCSIAYANCCTSLDPSRTRLTAHSIRFYNYCGLAVTKSLSAIHRTLIDALRTILVWGVDLLLFYAFNSPNYGEQWAVYGFLQVSCLD